MIPVYANGGAGRTATGEWDITVGTYRGWQGQRGPLIFCHGSGQHARYVWVEPTQRALIRQLAQRHLVTAPDLGLQVWGNPTHVSRIHAAKAWVNSLGATGPVVLVVASMGALGGLAYALQYPENVLCVAGIIPGLDLADLRVRGAAAEIDAAYGGAYNDAVHGPAHSPVRFAADLDPDLPVALWTASNDTITVPATADAFVAARPQTQRFDVGATDHSATSVLTAIPGVVSWVKTARR